MKILVLSQAVQSMGFEELGAAKALKEAFGAVDQAHLSEWMGGMEAEGPTAGSVLDLQRTVAALSANGGAQSVTLTKEITLNSALTLEKGSLTINLGGHTMTLSDAAISGWNLLYSTANAGSGWGFSVGKNAMLTMTGNGNVKAAFDLTSQGKDVKVKQDEDLVVYKDDMASDSDNWSENHLILNTGSLTLDLNNHDLTIAESSAADGFINILSGHLTMKGTGNVYSNHFAVFYPKIRRRQLKKN